MPLPKGSSGISIIVMNELYDMFYSWAGMNQDNSDSLDRDLERAAFVDYSDETSHHLKFICPNPICTKAGFLQLYSTLI